MSREGRERFLRPEPSKALNRQREGWLTLVDELT